MEYMMLICSDGVATEEKAETMARQLTPYVEQVKPRHVYGHRLAVSSEARTVQVRDGVTLVSDGPFAESKEFVAGFDIVRCEDDAEVVALAAQHPVSRFHCIEVRALGGCREGRVLGPVSPQLLGGPPAGTQRFAVFICVDGIDLGDEAEDAIADEAIAWGDRLRDAGICSFGTPLEGAAQATTVRVRHGQTIASDGPFVETKEYLAGLVVLDVPGIDDAVALAAEHPIARLHRLEVRPFHQEA
jgi:hypothetical protein